MITSNSPTSRKYKIVLLLIFISAIMCFLPPIVSVMVLKAASPLIVLTGTEWVSAMTMICGFYFGANVWQKKMTTSTQPEQNTSQETEETPKDK